MLARCRALLQGGDELRRPDGPRLPAAEPPEARSRLRQGIDQPRRVIARGHLCIDRDLWARSKRSCRRMNASSEVVGGTLNDHSVAADPQIFANPVPAVVLVVDDETVGAGVDRNLLEMQIGIGGERLGPVSP